MDWIGGLNWWADIFMLYNETHLSVELHDAYYFPQNSFLLEQTDFMPK